MLTYTVETSWNGQIQEVYRGFQPVGNVIAPPEGAHFICILNDHFIGEIEVYWLENKDALKELERYYREQNNITAPLEFRVFPI